jgi:hypothetical protein
MLKILEAKLRGRNMTVAYVKMRTSCDFVRTCLLYMLTRDCGGGNKSRIDQGSQEDEKVVHILTTFVRSSSPQFSQIIRRIHQ